MNIARIIDFINNETLLIIVLYENGLKFPLWRHPHNPFLAPQTEGFTPIEGIKKSLNTAKSTEARVSPRFCAFSINFV